MIDLQAFRAALADELTTTAPLGATVYPDAVDGQLSCPAIVFGVATVDFEDMPYRDKIELPVVCLVARSGISESETYRQLWALMTETVSVMRGLFDSGKFDQFAYQVNLARANDLALQVQGVDYPAYSILLEING